MVICHPHESAAACEVGDLCQANKRKTATGLKGEFLGGVLRSGFFARTLAYIDHRLSLPCLVGHHSLLCG